jgi:hypothetical protein
VHSFNIYDEVSRVQIGYYVQLTQFSLSLLCSAFLSISAFGDPPSLYKTSSHRIVIKFITCRKMKM